MIISFTLNSQPVEIDTPPHRRADNLLREEFGIRSLRITCGENNFGVSVILLDGQPVFSSTLPAFQLRFRQVQTVESIVDKPEFEDIEEGWRAAHVRPCPSCLPARALITEELASRASKPSEEELREAVDSVSCGCCSTRRLVDAIIRTLRIRERRTNEK